MANLKLKISGMTCDHCVRTVESALKGVSGAYAVLVELPDVAEVEYTDGSATAEEFTKVVEATGYGATLDQ